MQIAAVARRASKVVQPRFSLLQFIAQGGSTPPSYSSLGRGFSDGKSVSASFCSVAVAADGDPVKELHDKILESVKVKRSAPPNAWLWSILEKCKSRDDIKLLFDALQQLRIFRLSNLRIHDNFNCSLCQEVTKACTRVGALDFGKKALWRHNVYGLSPTIGSANQLLCYAKEKKDVRFMVDVMSHLKKNDLPLQPATADIVFSICYDADNWELISKYAKRFVKAGVKLRKTTFDIWLDFSSRRGDLESLQKIEKLRSNIYNRHTIKSGFACCKGLLLERKPEEAATLLQNLAQNFPDSKREDIIAELQKLVSEWPSEVIKHQNQEDRKAFITSLKADIPDMIKSLSSMGVDSRIKLEDINIAESLSC
ncbi:hypothetical protein RND81_14G030100 [Saponaria officinalis]|uniref:Adenylyl cyclase n=1 Tax=Saponaria officinalis TaxID=3572 RepID=A0AAW1GKT4_SAPOF